MTQLVTLESGAPGGAGLESMRLEWLDQMRRCWKAGQSITVADFVERFPELENHKLLLLDLIYEQYCLLQESGEAVDPQSFTARFPGLESSVERMIVLHVGWEQHSFLDRMSELIQWPEVGESIGGFRLIRQLGEGSFGHVFLAEEVSLANRLVVLKAAPRGDVEAATLGKLRHTNIVPIYSAKIDPATRLSAVCMPYLGLATLSDVIARVFAGSRIPKRGREILEAIAAANEGAEPPEPAESQRPGPPLHKQSYVDAIVLVIAQLAEALAHTHAKGICHRDLKPSNVLLAADGKPMLLDFNLSSDQGAARITGGTPAYMAPEQMEAAFGDQSRPAGQADPLWDIYSLGAIAYALLCGRPPFGSPQGGSAVAQCGAIARRRLSEGLPPIRRWNPSVDGRLAALIESCLAAEPDNRPPSCGELAARLRRHLSPGRRAFRWIRRHAWAVVTAGVLLLGGSGYAGYAIATQDPYAVRELKLGKAAYEQADYTAALKHFTRSVESDPASAEAWFLRGRARQGTGDYLLALEDFFHSRNIKPDPRVEACVGYCFGRLRRNEEAAAAFVDAISGGFESAQVYNNLGYVYLKHLRFAEARSALDKAIALNSQVQAAYHNRAMVELYESLLTGTMVSPDALAYADQAIQIGPATAEVLLDAARLCARTTESEAGRVARTLSYLRAAIELGASENDVRQAAKHFPPLAADPQFRQLVTKAADSRAAPKPAQRWLDPLGESH